MADWLQAPGADLVPVRTVPAEPPVLVRGARVAFGLATAAGQALDRATGGSGSVPTVVDAAIGAGAAGIEATAAGVGFVIGVVKPVADPVLSVLVDPPFLPDALRPTSVFAALTVRGASERGAMGSELANTAGALTPMIVDALTEQIDLTDLVISKVDLARVVATVLDEMDLTQLVLERVEIDRIAAQVSLDPIIDRIDMIDIANYIIDEIDLPKIVRESTGGLASEAVRGVRLQSMEFDDTISDGVDKVLQRKQRKTEVEGYTKRRRIKWLEKFQEDLSRGKSGVEVTDDISISSDITEGGGS